MELIIVGEMSCQVREGRGKLLDTDLGRAQSAEGQPAAHSPVMVLSCLLCHSPAFNDLSSLISALSSLLTCPLACPLPHCGHTELGLDNLVRHLSSHQASDNMNNIEQVIRDLEDLVQTDITIKSDNSIPVMNQSSGGWMTDWNIPTPTPTPTPTPAPSTSITDFSVSSSYYPSLPAVKNTQTGLTMKGTDCQFRDE